ncbi:MAG: DUF2281 domain-containing protein [Synechocystis sp.]
MTTRERWIQEIHQIPEEIVEELLDFLLFTQARRNQQKEQQTPRPYALCQGEFTVPADFDDPLPDEILQDFENPL